MSAAPGAALSARETGALVLASGYKPPLPPSSSIPAAMA